MMYVFLGITIVAWIVTAICLPQQFKVSTHNKRFLFFYLLTILATLGFFLSGLNLMKQFCFFEIMTLASFAYVPNDETTYAKKSAFSYLAYGIVGGLVMLYGLMILYDMFGTFELREMQSMLVGVAVEPENQKRLYLAGACLLFGYGAKAGMFPFHTWLPDTYTAAPSNGTTLLSSVLSKTGIYGIWLLTVFLFSEAVTWNKALLILALCTMFVGGFFALFATDMKKILAYSSMSQIGFILFGISIFTMSEETDIETWGTLFHVANHSLFKLILFTAAALLYGMTKTTDLNKLAGYANQKKWLKIPVAIAALGMGGLPFLSGYISKTMLHESLMVTPQYQTMLPAAEWIFLISGGFTVAYMLKLYMAVFHNKKQEEAEEICEAKPSKAGIVCLWILAAVVVTGGILGIVLEPGYFLSLESLKGACISILIGILLYRLVIRHLAFSREEDGSFSCCQVIPSWFGLEKMIYRPLFLQFFPFIGALFFRLFDRIIDGFSIAMMKTLLRPKKLRVKQEHMVAYGLGRFVDGITYVVQVKIRKKPAERRRSYGDLFAVGSAEFSRTTQLVFYSVSFGLMMFAIGLMAALFYLLKVL